MMLSLATTTLLTGLVLLILGGLFLLDLAGWRRAVQAFPRSVLASYVCMGAAGAWFTYKMLHLSPADFGSFKVYIAALFGVVALASFVYLKDFLAVRGLAGLFLLVAMEILRSAFGHYELPQRLFLVGFVYAGILLALVIGYSPWLVRDFLEWLYRGAQRSRILGGILAAYGLLLLAITFTY